MNYRNGKLKSLELYEEQYNGEMHHFLKGVWEYETVTGRYELTIPKIDLGNSFYKVPEVTCDSVCNYTSCVFQLYHIPFFKDYLKLVPDEQGNECYIKELEKFGKEMTLKEIEKKLGYKIKLVSGKEENNGTNE